MKKGNTLVVAHRAKGVKRVSANSADLKGLIAQTNKAYSTLRTSTLKGAIAVGDLLLEGRRRVKHGEFYLYLRRLDIPPRSSSTYIKLAGNEEIREAAVQGRLTTAAAALQFIPPKQTPAKPASPGQQPQANWPHNNNTNPDTNPVNWLRAHMFEYDHYRYRIEDTISGVNLKGLDKERRVYVCWIRDALKAALAHVEKILEKPSNISADVKEALAVGEITRTQETAILQSLTTRERKRWPSWNEEREQLWRALVELGPASLQEKGLPPEWATLADSNAPRVITPLKTFPAEVLVAEMRPDLATNNSPIAEASEVENDLADLR